jgi:hypothetical protein
VGDRFDAKFGYPEVRSTSANKTLDFRCKGSVHGWAHMSPKGSNAEAWKRIPGSSQWELDCPAPLHGDEHGHETKKQWNNQDLET